MKHIVIKLGGSVLRSPCDARAVLDILAGYPDPIVVVVSALKGVTERLAEALSATGRRAALISELRDEYCGFAAAFGAPFAAEAAARMQIERLLGALELLFARDAARSASPTVGGKDAASGEAARSSGRASSRWGSGSRRPAISLALVSIGRPAPVIEPGKLGLVARRSACPSSGREDEAVADIAASAPRIRAALGAVRPARPFSGRAGLLRRRRGRHPRLFGRGGSDYSAAVSRHAWARRAVTSSRTSTASIPPIPPSSKARGSSWNSATRRPRPSLVAARRSSTKTASLPFATRACRFEFSAAPLRKFGSRLASVWAARGDPGAARQWP